MTLGIREGEWDDYGFRCGLELNLPRLLSRQALASAIGACATSGRVSWTLFDGITDSEDEAQELAFEVNKKRDEAALAQKAKQGWAGVIGAR